jgi:hypothetical protein
VEGDAAWIHTFTLKAESYALKIAIKNNSGNCRRKKAKEKPFRFRKSFSFGYKLSVLPVPELPLFGRVILPAERLAFPFLSGEPELVGYK